MPRLLLFIFFVITQSPAMAESDPFWWGVGNAAFQVEGSPADSDWRRWTQTLTNVADGSDAAVATDFWHHPEKDFDLAQKLGAKMFRLSIAWERIEPRPGQWDEDALAHYESMLVDLRRRGIEPLVTLQHFVLPTWLADKGGLTAPDFAEQFARYAVKVVRKLANGPAHVQWWMTFNEPMVLISAGYVTGEWPPNRRNPLAAWSAEDGLIRAHVLAVQSIWDEPDLPKLKISIATHWRDFQAHDFWFLNSSVAGIADWLFNRRILNAIAPSINYVGINYYGRTVLHLSWQPPFFTVDEGEGPKTDIGWVIYPQGLDHVLHAAHAAYHLPVLISENGIADARDSQRADFLLDHVKQIRSAIRAGIPVIGYLHWSLTDNFEWAKGLAPRFGLVEMDYTTGKRKPRPSFYVYKDIIKSGP